jgi:GntR family transcriptional regulator
MSLLAPTVPATNAATGNAAVTVGRSVRNTADLASGIVAGHATSAGRRGAAHAHEVRRLRDLLRSAVLRGAYPGGALPGEAELMAAHALSRNTVREALALLREEGLIERTQGVGTHVVATAVLTRLAEAHGAADPVRDSIFNRRMRPQVLDCSVLAAPDPVAGRLGVAAGTPVLRLEYVALLGDEPMGLATNYVLFPEAAAVRDTPFVSDWYALLADAGVRLGESEFVFGCASADPLTAPLLEVPPGSPLIAMEQLITDPDGRRFDVAYVHTRGDRFLFISKAWRQPAR